MEMLPKPAVFNVRTKMPPAPQQEPAISGNSIAIFFMEISFVTKLCAALGTDREHEAL